MYKNASKGRALRQRVRSWDLCAPFFHLHDRQERPTLPLDHAELCAQTICENAGGNGAYQVLPGMIWDSAYPPHAAHGMRGELPATLVCMDAWVAKVTGLSEEDNFSLIMAGLKNTLQ